MKKKLSILLCLLAFWPVAHAQKITVKSNLLYDATTTLNLGAEFALAPRWTLDMPFNFNPWKFGDGARLRHWGLQPEIRYWFCEVFNRGFIGLHGHYSDFNAGGWPNWSLFSGNMQQNRYQGYLYGAGVSIGYSWILKKRWSLEASLGLGYAHIVYDKYPCAACGTKVKEGEKDYFGPTKAAVSLIYTLK